MTAVAITDTSNIHGCHEFYKYAKEDWIKPILWTEIFLYVKFPLTASVLFQRFHILAM